MTRTSALDENEERLESAYWGFDASVKAGNKNHRDAFKQAMRQAFPRLFELREPLTFAEAVKEDGT